MKVFAQLSKVDVEKRLVYGIAAQEVADHSGEIMDYEKSKPNFISWSDEVSKSTDGKSLGNIRSMHSNVAAGKMVDMSFDDANKSISIVAKVVDDNEWQKVLEGVYTGFSMGGKYGEKWKDGDLKRYEAIPSEISLVDRPCIPTAKFFDIQKADGSMIKMEFKNMNTQEELDASNVLKSETSNEVGGIGGGGHSAEVQTEVEYQVVGTEADIESLGKMLNTNGLTVADAVVALGKSLEDKANQVKAEEIAKAEELSKAEFKENLKKGMYDIGRLAELLQSIYYMTLSAKYEADHEMDNSPLPSKLKSVAESVASILKEMVTEETDELIADLKEDMMEGEEEEMNGIMERSLSIAGLVKQLKDKDGLAKSLKEISDKMNVVEVKEENKEEIKKFESFDTEQLIKSEIIQKAINDAINNAIEPLSKALTESQEKIKVLEAQPMPTKGVLRVVAKSEDVAELKKDVETVVVRKADGSVDSAASLIKNIHAQGGQSFM